MLNYAILRVIALIQEGKYMSKETLILLYGGRSAEREVSVLSAESVMRAINYDKFLSKPISLARPGTLLRRKSFLKHRLPMKNS